MWGNPPKLVTRWRDAPMSGSGHRGNYASECPLPQHGQSHTARAHTLAVDWRLLFLNFVTTPDLILWHHNKCVKLSVCGQGSDLIYVPRCVLWRNHNIWSVQSCKALPFNPIYEWYPRSTISVVQHVRKGWALWKRGRHLKSRFRHVMCTVTAQEPCSEDDAFLMSLLCDEEKKKNSRRITPSSCYKFFLSLGSGDVCQTVTNNFGKLFRSNIALHVIFNILVAPVLRYISQKYLQTIIR